MREEEELVRIARMIIAIKRTTIVVLNVERRKEDIFFKGVCSDEDGNNVAMYIF